MALVLACDIRTFIGLIALLDSAILTIGTLMILMDDRDEEESGKLDSRFGRCSRGEALTLGFERVSECVSEIWLRRLGCCC